MENTHLVEESQQINQQYQNPQTSENRFQSLQSQDEDDENQQINNSHFKNLSSSSIQNVLSSQNSNLDQENQDDDFNFITREQNQKNNIENQQNEQQILPLENDQNEEKIIQNDSKITQTQVVQNEEPQTDQLEDKNHSQINNNSEDKDIKQVSVNILIKHIPTETSDQKYELQRGNEVEQNIQKIQNSSQHVEKLKSIIKSPKSGTSNVQSGDPSIDKSISPEQILKQKRNEKLYNQIMETNLNEIFLFYSKQFQSPLKLPTKTKESIFEKKSFLSLPQYMHFCRDFQLIDLLVTNEFIEKYAGPKNQKPLYKIKYKNRVKDSFIVTKQILQEIFQKCSGIQQLSFSEFQYSLIKIADVVFPVSNSINALYLYLGIHDPEIYNKKLSTIQDMNQSRIQNQDNIITKQDVKKILPTIVNKPQIDHQNSQDTSQISKFNYIQETHKRHKAQQNTNQSYSIRWEDLVNSESEFDPRKLLLDEDLTDQDDAIYLKEYMISEVGIKKKQDFLKQYQEGERIKYSQYPYQNYQQRRKQGYTENSSREQNPSSLQGRLIFQKETMFLQKIQELPEAQLVYPTLPINQTSQMLQKERGQQLIHPNSFEQRKNYNVIKQLPSLNKSYANQNVSSSIERGQQNISQIDHVSKQNLRKLEINQKKRDQQIYVGMLKLQDIKARKVQRK
ncbi:unnamed protein product (macronuclear) [Paramecium tetraurelia]|uniref:Uncharacterized protein n=1 Tax=Paramecium tetraurelia TaxID=5888 RepID=A0CND0_PARTE|nr:uncharacterized protein GSPATT00008739001 [Paramecium tetraurelia]CAK72297.1 unnamed protein product [Paramecium tetraurelia]|eukprot:XP_001439694.1 hypothetical protein (macronuclear) [Paramecium tetraurelia strain d4-2]